MINQSGPISGVSEEFCIKLKSVFESQKKNQHAIRSTGAAQRIEKLQRLKKSILKHKEEIAESGYLDFQRPRVMNYIYEVGIMMTHIDYATANLAEWMKSEPVELVTAKAESAEIIHEPKGVVLIIGPWNVPFMLTLYPLVSAIAAGNTAIVKPSELTPHNSEVVRKVIHECFSDDEVAVIEGGIAETSEILKLPFDHIYFTGSSKVAKVIMRAAAENLASVTLELGGKAPAIIHESADLDKAAYRIVNFKQQNAGQICMNTDYVLIPADLQPAFIEKAKATLHDSFGASGSFNYDDYPQIINQTNYDRIKRLFDDAVDKGAQVAVGGVFEDSLRKIQPTILTNVSTDAALMTEEIFGPLLPVFNYTTKEDAVDFVRRFDKPLAAYVFSEDREFAAYILNNTTSGGAAVNDVLLQSILPELPTGGVNQSGMGKGYGKAGFLEMSNAKGVVYQSSSEPKEQFLSPPYEGKAEIVASQFSQLT